MHVGQGLEVADVSQDLLLGDEFISQVANENFGLFAKSSPEMQSKATFRQTAQVSKWETLVLPQKRSNHPVQNTPRAGFHLVKVNKSHQSE